MFVHTIGLSSLASSWWCTNCLFNILDINECLKDNGGCNGRCVNTFGSYKCECSVGFQNNEKDEICRGICQINFQQKSSMFCAAALFLLS